MKMLNTVPKLKLNANCISVKASNMGLWCMRGEPLPIEYIVDKEEMLLVTDSHGYLRIPHRDLEQVIEELSYISDELKDIKETLK